MLLLDGYAHNQGLLDLRKHWCNRGKKGPLALAAIDDEALFRPIPSGTGLIRSHWGFFWGGGEGTGVASARPDNRVVGDKGG